ncbi:exopolysaccharide biosynthesis protein [Anaplasmataceae bacterium AB001_6]|nr:exopolysaccharide biosynthesis protein [Anaplasmataceae bacterium AB001_6]
MKKHRNILEILKEIRDIRKDKIETSVKEDNDRITLLEIIAVLHAKGFAILILLFCLPLTVPLPVPPGYTTVFSIPTLLFSVQMLFGRQAPWLPKKIAEIKIKRSILAYLVEKTSPILHKIEHFSRARIMFFSSKKGEKLYAIICLICSLAIALPLPMTNMIPAIGLSIYSIALINRDGLLAILAILICITGLIVTSLVIILGSKFVHLMLNIIKK